MMTGFMLRFDSLEEYSVLSNEEFGKLIRAGLQFAIDGTEPDLSEPESYLWPGMKLKILHDAEQYRRKCEKNAENIRRRWERQKDSNVYDRIRTNTNDTNNNNNYNNNNNGNNNIDIASAGNKQKKRFIPPTVEEVRQYCQERNNGIDPEQFVDYYQARGWFLKPGQQVKDWKACVRTWESNNRKGGNSYAGNNARDYAKNQNPKQRELYEL